MSVRDDLIGRTVSHGNLTGKVTAVTPEYIAVEDRRNKGIIRIPVPAHLREALEAES